MNIYEAVTERILKKMEQGVIPWRKTWTTGLPKSLTTGKEYRGMNIVLLGLAGFDSRYWVTFRETQRLGGYVRKGEKATPVYFWHWRTPEELEKLRQKTGKRDLAPCTSFISFAFNLDQVEGIERPSDEIPLRTINTIDLAENVLEIMPNKPEIVHARTSDPCYNRKTDRITLPHLSQFESGAEYYATLFHELIHSTGHAKRLNRFAESEGDRVERYSFEELVAEFGASFLRGFTGIEDSTGEALSASYIEGWAAVFRKDNRILMRAASAAQKAADFIRGKVIADDQPALAA